MVKLKANTTVKNISRYNNLRQGKILNSTTKNSTIGIECDISKK